MGWISTLFFGNAGLPTTASAVGRPKVNLSCEKGVIGMKSKGFTLIELLIVVAIIAILAAIAVPNFLEAQMRAKVSSVQSDLRSMTTGIESFQVENNIYPRAASNLANSLNAGPAAKTPGSEASKRCTFALVSSPDALIGAA